MALKADTITKIATILKLKPEDLTAAIADAAERDISIDDKLTSFTETELTTLNKNKYEEGKKAGVEMGVDELKKELSLDFQGKTMKGLVEAANKKAVADAKIEPNEKVKELEGKLATVQATAKDYETKLQSKEQEYEALKMTGDIHKDIPDFGENAPALAKDDVVNLMKANGYEFKSDSTYLNGKQVQDKLGNAVPRKDVVQGFLKDKKIITDAPPPPAGRGGGNDKPPASFSKLSEIKNKFVADGKSLNGAEFMDAVEQAQQANKDFDMKS